MGWKESLRVKSVPRTAASERLALAAIAPCVNHLYVHFVQMRQVELQTVLQPPPARREHLQERRGFLSGENLPQSFQGW